MSIENFPSPDSTGAKEAPPSYLDLIAALHPDTPEAEHYPVAVAILDANLLAVGRERAIVAMVKNLRCRKEYVKTLLKKAGADRASKAAKEAPPDEMLAGKLVFRYKDEFHFDEATDKCVDALLWRNKEENLPIFSSLGRRPVMLRESNEEGRRRFSLQPLDKSAFWVRLTEMLTFVNVTDQGDDGARKMVPREVAEHVYGITGESLPQAPEIAYTPLFLKDGRLISEPGYHYDAENPHYLNVLLIDSDLNMPPVPMEPTVEEMEEAMAWLRLELLSDFPFCEFDVDGKVRREPSEAHALAMIFTPFMRRMIYGRTPVFFIEKPTPGTGGTILGQLPMWLFDGEPGSVTRYSKNEEEMQKGLIAAVQSRQSHLFFDDVSEFNNRELLRAITQENVSGRLLGSNDNVSVPNHFNWIGTGNNTIIYDEMARRISYIRMNPLTDDVSKRTFRHPDVSGMTYERFVKANRGVAVRHILTCIQYWISTGRKPFKLRHKKSFEGWSEMVGGVLQACGVEGFLDSVVEIKMDQNTNVNRSFFREFREKYGTDKAVSPRQIFDWADSIEHSIITGNTGDQKREKFTKHTLFMLHGKIYRVGNVNLMMMRTINKDDEVAYKIVEVGEVETINVL